MDVQNITIFAAFAAGLLSFISPCVLPLVPVFLGYLTGSTTVGSEQAPPRKLVMSHAIMFVLGFTFIFTVVFGAPAGFLGGSLGDFAGWLVWIGGAFLIVFGLHTMGLITIPIFNLQKRMEVGQGQAPGYTRSALVGATFGAGWTPCIGPLLGAILTLAISGQAVGQAMFLLFVYSMGLAIPFLASAWMLSSATNRLRVITRHMVTIERVSGVFLVIIGLLLVTNTFARLNIIFNSFVPESIIQYL